MLDSRSNDVLSRFRKAENRQVIPLRSAAGEDDLRSPASQQGRYRLARMLDRRPCLLSMMMDGRGIAETLAEIRLHRRKNLRQNRSGGVVVEINTTHIHPILRFNASMFSAGMVAYWSFCAGVSLMKKVRPGLPVFFCVTFFIGSIFGQKRVITEKDLFQFHWIGNPQVSPEGTQVAFVQIAVDEKREDYETSLWSVSANGGEPHR